MRWGRKTLPVDGALRSERRFIWWPRRLRMAGSRTYETRWLSRSTIVYRYFLSDGGWDAIAWED